MLWGSEEPLKCPFCGGNTYTEHFNGHFRVRCHQCLSCSDYSNTKEDAIRGWNNRAATEIVRRTFSSPKNANEKENYPEKQDSSKEMPLVPKWVDIGGGRYYSEVSIMQAVKMVFEIKYDTYDDPFLYTLKAFFKVWDSECDYEEEYGVFNTLKEAKQKANECIRELGERLVFYAENIKTKE